MCNVEIIVLHSRTFSSLHHTDRHIQTMLLYPDHDTLHSQTHRPLYVTQMDTQIMLHHT